MLCIDRLRLELPRDALAVPINASLTQYRYFNVFSDLPRRSV